MAEKENRNEDWETYVDNPDALSEEAIEGVVLAMELMKRQAMQEAKTATIH